MAGLLDNVGAYLLIRGIKGANTPTPIKLSNILNAATCFAALFVLMAARIPVKHVPRLLPSTMAMEKGKLSSPVA